MKAHETLLRTNDLSRQFRLGHQAFYAVSKVNIDIRNGETLGLVGESGCGKSTLGRMITSLIRPSEGTIQYRDMELTQLKGKALRDVRREIQMVFQDPYASLNPRMRIEDIIREPLFINKVGSASEQKEKVKELMEIVGIPTEYKSRFPHQFSGGQRQRIGIARALVLNPRLVVCDEPVSALDVSIQAQVLNLLMKLQEQFALTYLFISHDLNVVEHICDRVSIMYLGHLCELASKEEVFSSPRHPYTHFLLSSNPVLDPTKRREDREILTGDVASPVNPPPGCRFHPRCPYAKDICKEQEPPMTQEGERLYACHFPLK